MSGFASLHVEKFTYLFNLHVRTVKQSKMRTESCLCPASLISACLVRCIIPSSTESIPSPTQRGCDQAANRKYSGCLAENWGLHHLAQQPGKAPGRGMLLAEFSVNLRSESKRIRDAVPGSKPPLLFQG